MNWKPFCDFVCEHISSFSLTLTEEGKIKLDNLEPQLQQLHPFENCLYDNNSLIIDGPDNYQTFLSLTTYFKDYYIIEEQKNGYYLHKMSS